MNHTDIEKKIRRLQFWAKASITSDLHGNYSSAYKGSGLEFDDFRQYVYGDDVKHIDWKVTARSEKTYIRLFKEERDLNVLLMLDISSSMYFGSVPGKTKIFQLSQLAAVISTLCSITKDKCSVVLFSDEIKNYYSHKFAKSHKKSNQIFIFNILKNILADNVNSSKQCNMTKKADKTHGKSIKKVVNDNNKKDEDSDKNNKYSTSKNLKKTNYSKKKESYSKTNLNDAFLWARKYLTKKHLIFVISDFLDDQPYSVNLKALSARHDVSCIRVLDPLEINPVKSKKFNYVDLESDNTYCGNLPALNFRSFVNYKNLFKNKNKDKDNKNIEGKDKESKDKKRKDKKSLFSSDDKNTSNQQIINKNNKLKTNNDNFESSIMRLGAMSCEIDTLSCPIQLIKMLIKKQSMKRSKSYY